MTTWITICDTCKRPGWAETGAEVTDGARLAEAVEAAVAALPDAGLRTRRVSCTMGCDRACNITVQAAGKLCYSLGLFDPDDPEAAPAIAAWAALHAQSDTGQVPFRQWPVGVKGHFVSRHAPLPADDA